MLSKIITIRNLPLQDALTILSLYLMITINFVVLFVMAEEHMHQWESLTAYSLDNILNSCAWL